MTQSPNTPPQAPAHESQPNGTELTNTLFLGVGSIATGIATAAEASFGTFSLPANYEVAVIFVAIGTGILAVGGIKQAIQTRRQGVGKVNHAS